MPAQPPIIDAEFEEVSGPNEATDWDNFELYPPSNPEDDEVQFELGERVYLLSSYGPGGLLMAWYAPVVAWKHFSRFLRRAPGRIQRWLRRSRMTRAEKAEIKRLQRASRESDVNLRFALRDYDRAVRRKSGQKRLTGPK